MIKKGNKGFTLIELLVVIAIIGILSSIVLASLNSARDKGKDASIKANLSSIRVEAELFFDENSSAYSGLCADTQVTNMINEASAQSTGTATCGADANEWVAFATLSDSTVYCVDYKGFASVSASAAATVDGDIDCD